LGTAFTVEATHLKSKTHDGSANDKPTPQIWFRLLPNSENLTVQNCQQKNWQ